jgi:hypothetical protein
MTGQIIAIMKGFQMEISVLNAMSIQSPFLEAQVTKSIVSDSEPPELCSGRVSFRRRDQCRRSDTSGRSI